MFKHVCQQMTGCTVTKPEAQRLLTYVYAMLELDSLML